MTPPRPDRDVVRNKLNVIEESLDTLAALGEVSAERLRGDDVIRAAVERLLSRVVDQAVEISSHLAVSRLARAPGTYRESFQLVQELGVIDDDLSDDLMRSVAMRNIIVHGYVDLDLDLVAKSVPMAQEQYRRFVTAVAAHLVGEKGE